VDEEQRRSGEVDEPDVEAHQKKHDSLVDEGTDDEIEEPDFELHQKKHDS
jgi:hypothetical protein